MIAKDKVVNKPHDIGVVYPIYLLVVLHYWPHFCEPLQQRNLAFCLLKPMVVILNDLQRHIPSLTSLCFSVNRINDLLK